MAFFFFSLSPPSSGTIRHGEGKRHEGLGGPATSSVSHPVSRLMATFPPLFPLFVADPSEPGE